MSGKDLVDSKVCRKDLSMIGLRLPDSSLLGAVLVGLIIAGCASSSEETVSDIAAVSPTSQSPSTREAERSQIDQFIVAGYLPDYRLDDWFPTKRTVLTDLIYYGIEPPEDGIVTDMILSSEVLIRLQAIKETQGYRLLLCVGGGRRSAGFAEFVDNPQVRKRFVEGISSWCLDHGFSGIDYDWEHPRGDEEVANYTSLILETKQKFKPSGLIVTVAQATRLNLGLSVYDAVDRVHLMSYNHPYPQATMMKSWIDVQRVLAWGCPPEKLVLGVPFYGRNSDHRSIPYRDLIQGRNVDPASDVIDGYAFNGPKLIVTKTQYAMNNGLAGIMIWELGQDVHGEKSLLKAINGSLAAEEQH